MISFLYIYTKGIGSSSNIEGFADNISKDILSGFSRSVSLLYTSILS